MNTKSTEWTSSPAFAAAYEAWRAQNDSAVTAERPCFSLATTVETPAFVMPAETLPHGADCGPLCLACTLVD